MDPRRITTLLVFTFAIFASAFSALIPLGIVNIGGGLIRSYHAENTTRNWTESVEFCKSLGPKFALATALTTTAIDFLKDVPDSVNFFGTHWIDAVLASPDKVMAWGSAAGALIGGTIGDWHDPTPTLCGIFYSSGATSYLRPISCSLSYKTLCEQIP